VKDFSVVAMHVRKAFVSLVLVSLYLLQVYADVPVQEAKGSGSQDLDVVEGDVAWSPRENQDNPDTLHININNRVTTIIGTVDGYIHGMNSDNQAVWKSALLPGGSMAHSHNSNNQKTESEYGPEDDENKEQEQSFNDGSRPYSVIPTVDGSIIIHSPQGMRKTTVKTQVLAEKAPYSSKDGLIFTGQKYSRLLGVDLNTGRVLHDTSDAIAGSSEEIPTLRLKTRQRSAEQTGHLWIGRVDYTLRAYDDMTGQEEYNLTYSELYPMNSSRVNVMEGLVSPMKIGFGKGNEEVEIEIDTETGLPLTSSNQVHAHKKAPLPLVSTPNGDLYFADEFGNLGTFPSISLGSPAVCAFSVDDYMNSNGEPAEVRPLQVLHMLQDNKDDGKNAADVHEQDEDAHTLVVRSHQGNGGVYAMEMPATTTVQSVIDESLSRRDMKDEDNRFLPDKELLSSYRELPPDLSKAVAIGKLGRDTSVQDTQSAVVAGKKAQALLANVKNAKDSGNACTSYVPGAGNYGLDDKIMMLPGPSDSQCFSLLGRHPLLSDVISPMQSTEFDEYLEAPQYKPEPEPSAIVRFIRRLETLVLYAVFVLALIVVLRRFDVELPAPVDATINFLKEHVIMQVLGVESSFQGAATLDTSSPAYAAPFIDVHGNRVTTVGSIQITDKVLGYGSQGTIVLRGSLNGRPVAVKRMLSQLSGSADREIALLIRSDGHLNVVRYFLREKKEEFVYLALQLCHMSLRDFISKVQKRKTALKKTSPKGQRKPPGPGGDSLTHADISYEVKAALLQVCQGLNHLHSQRIVHRDIKPHNILCALPDDALDDPVRNSEDITSLKQLSGYILKISDMGLSKQLDAGDGSFNSMSMSAGTLFGEHGSQSNMSSDANASISSKKEIQAKNQVGTIGWQAPEMLFTRGQRDAGIELVFEFDEDAVNADAETSNKDSRKSSTKAISTSNRFDVLTDMTDKEDDSVSVSSASEVSQLTAAKQKPKSKTSATDHNRLTQMLDIFSLGCVLHYVLIPGEHPFGQWFEREANIVNDKLDLAHLKKTPDALDLLTRMLRRNQRTRPSASEVCSHPFFWQASKKLDFLTELSDRLEHEPAESACVLALERNAEVIIGKAGWESRLDLLLLEDMSKYRRYDTTSVRDLLRLIRNKRHHFHELPESTKALMSPLPIGFQLYFDLRFPELLLHCVQMTCSALPKDKICTDYCQSCIYMFRKDKQLLALANPKSDAAAKAAGVGEIAEAEAGTGTDAGSAAIDEVEVDNASAWEPLSPTSYSKRIARDDTTLDTPDQRQWYDTSDTWVDELSPYKTCYSKGVRPIHIQRYTTDFKYRTRICTHWENTNGAMCAMRKKGKCDFAHGPVELRVRETRRALWEQKAIALMHRQETEEGRSATCSHVIFEDAYNAARHLNETHNNVNNQMRAQVSFTGANKYSDDSSKRNAYGQQQASFGSPDRFARTLEEYPHDYRNNGGMDQAQDYSLQQLHGQQLAQQVEHQQLLNYMQQNQLQLQYWHQLQQQQQNYNTSPNTPQNSWEHSSAHVAPISTPGGHASQLRKNTAEFVPGAKKK